MNDEDEPIEDDFDEEYNDAGEMDMDGEAELFDDDVDEEGSDNNEEAEEDDGFGESDVSDSRIGHCRYCGAEIVVEELPDSISKDAFEDFGICLNCQWGLFMDNGGHF